MLLELQNVTKRFGGLVAVNDVSFSVQAGQIFGLIGPNGAGKTTIINVISGFYKPDGGHVLFDGQDISGFAPYRICQTGISRTFQIVHSFHKMTALENVMVARQFGTQQFDSRAAAEKSREILDFVQFPMPVDTPAGQLNTMQLKRLDLARALASDCKLLLLDELAAGLTPTELNDMVTVIKSIRDHGVTIITIEHVLKFIMCICDQIVVVQHGTKICSGSCAEVVNDEKVQKAYLGDKYIL